MAFLDSGGDLSLSGMPTEILSIIVNLVDPTTLPALRLTNKRLRAVSNTPFALKHFSERKQVASAYSMDALIEITAHPFFRKFVKTVMVSGYRPEPLKPQRERGKCVQCGRPQSNSYCTSPAIHNLTLNQAQLVEKLEQVFSNIKRSSSSVMIGVCDRWKDCYGSSGYMKYERCGRFPLSSSGRKSYITAAAIRRSRDGLYNIDRTFRAILQAAKISECDIDGVKLNISPDPMPQDDMVAHRREMLIILSRSVDRLPQMPSFELSFSPKGLRDPQTHLKYDRNRSQLELSGYSSEWPSDNDRVPNTLLVLVQLPPFPIVSAKLENCSFHGLELLWISQSPTLRSLALRNVTLDTGSFDANFWSSFLDKLARATHLKHFEISHARYDFVHHLTFDDVDCYWFLNLSGEKYRLTDDIIWDQVASFGLAFSADENENLVLTDQASISVQLKAFADRVAQ